MPPLSPSLGDREQFKFRDASVGGNGNSKVAVIHEQPSSDPVPVRIEPYKAATITNDPVTFDITQIVFTRQDNSTLTMNFSYDAYSNLTGWTTA